MYLFGAVGIAFLALTVAAGWAVVSRQKMGLSSLEAAVASPVAGVVLASWPCLLTFLVTGSFDAGILVTAALLALLVVALKPWTQGPVIDGSHLPALLVIIVASFLFMYVGLLNYYGGEYHIAYPAFGDAAFHSALVTSFSQGYNYPPQYPVMAGEPLRYAFLIDFYSAALDRAGLGLQWSIVLPGALLLSSLLATIYFLGCRLTRRRFGGSLAVALIVFSGGLGFVQAFGDWRSSGLSLPDFLGSANLNYTCRLDLNYVFTNFIVIVMNQRAALTGFAAGALIMLLLYMLYVERKGGDRERKAILTFAGVMAGLLPAFHTYSYACVMLSTALLFIVYREKRWHDFIIPALLLALPQAIWISGQGTQSFIRLQAGWMAGPLWNIPWFWLQNMGIGLLLLIAGLLVAGRKIALFYMPYLGIFVLANLILFQPWDYDNHKFFSFWLMASVPLMAAALLRVYDTRSIGKPLCALLLFFAVLTGALVAYFILGQPYVEFGQDSVQVAQWVKDNTPPDAVFLTGDSPTHPVTCLAGRKSYLGYYPWMFTHGVDTSERLATVRSIYEADSLEAAMGLLKERGIDYVSLGPEERRSQTYRVNETLFNGLAPAFDWTSPSGENYRIFKVG